MEQETIQKDTQNKKLGEYWVWVDGRQVFTADFVFEQISAQSRIINRIKQISLASAAMALISVVLALICTIAISR